MGNGFIYKCPNCRHETLLRMGIGFICHNPPEIEADVKAGVYGEKAKAFLNSYSEVLLYASLEIYRCRCGNIQNEYHIVMKSNTGKRFFNRQRCGKCGSVMKLLTEPPEKVHCSECGSVMDLDIIEEILWD